MIKQLREKTGMTQSQAAKKLKINVGFWCRVESGDVGLPPRHFKKVSEIFKVPIGRLVNSRIQEFTKRLKAEVYEH